MANKTVADPRDSARRWSEAEARAALGELARTSESRFAFARRTNVSPQRLIYWQKKLGHEGHATPAFVSVALPPRRDAGHAEITIQVGSVVVVVREGANVEYVARLVASLSRTAPSC